MRTLTICRDRKFSSDIAPQDISDVLESQSNVVWLDIEAPGAEDVRLLRDEFGFHPLAIEDATRAHERPKVDAYEHAVLQHPLGPEDEPAPQPDDGKEPGRQAYYFIVFYEAEFDASHDHVTTEAINMFVGSNYLVTVHEGPTHTIQATLARWKAPDSPLGGSVGALVHAFLDAIVDDYFPLMDHVADRVEELEDSIFERFNERRDPEHLRAEEGPARRCAASSRPNATCSTSCCAASCRSSAPQTSPTCRTSTTTSSASPTTSTPIAICCPARSTPTCPSSRTT